MVPPPNGTAVLTVLNLLRFSWVGSSLLSRKILGIGVIFYIGNRPRETQPSWVQGFNRILREQSFGPFYRHFFLTVR